VLTEGPAGSPGLGRGSDRPFGRRVCRLLLLATLVLAPPAARRDVIARQTEPAATRSPVAVRVFVQETDNLQWMAFWVAEGAGLFEREGLDVQVVTGNGRMLSQGQADVAIMPRPMFLTFVGDGEPLVAFANLLANDPINLVVSRAAAEARGLSPDMSLADRLAALRGLRIGVAPGPPARLRALYDSAGLDAARDIEMVIVEGEGQSAAFAEGRVDALYTHTPYLERALDTQDAVMVVNQSAGEVPELAGRQIHMAVATRRYISEHADVVSAFTRALYRSQQLIHADRDATMRAIRASSVTLQEPGSLGTIVSLYEPAVPRIPDVSPEGALRELALFPDRRRQPDLRDVDLGAHIDNRFAREAVAGSR
jgi:NitT/TauT family transport system substrate-binding protein